MPYIPREHKQYKLLPFCHKNNLEVFEYPPDLLAEVNKILPDNKTLMPYGYKSYEEYYETLDNLIEESDDDDVKNLIDLFGNRMVMLNIKETWAVLQYIGETTDDNSSLGLTHNKYYYSPNPTSFSGMFQIIDDEEFTSYLYPCDSSDWILYEDPTGEASKSLNQKPIKDLMCPCCNKHYFLPSTDNICPVCMWEFDIIQHQHPDEDGGANYLSLNESKKLFNPNGIDLTHIYHDAFKNLSPSQTEFMCREFAIEKDVLLSLSERQLNCIYSILELIEETEYEHKNHSSYRCKTVHRILTRIDKFFKNHI